MQKLRKFFLAAGALALLAPALLSGGGCRQSAGQLTADQTKAFDNAPAEVKQAWDKALAADKANDYVTAGAALDSLKKMTLSDQQSQALEAERAAFGLRVMKAAEKNDPAAIQAVQNSKKNQSR